MGVEHSNRLFLTLSSSGLRTPPFTAVTRVRNCRAPSQPPIPSHFFPVRVATLESGFEPHKYGVCGLFHSMHRGASWRTEMHQSADFIGADWHAKRNCIPSEQTRRSVKVKCLRREWEASFDKGMPLLRSSSASGRSTTQKEGDGPKLDSPITRIYGSKPGSS